MDNVLKEGKKGEQTSEEVFWILQRDDDGLDECGQWQWWYEIKDEL